MISFLYWRLIREPLISLGRIGCLNFHPAPLPDLRGLGGYNVAILEGLRRVGRVLPLRRRALRHRRPGRGRALPDRRGGRATAFSLDLASQERLLASVPAGDGARAAPARSCRAAPQGEGRYVTREEFEELRRVRPGDDVGAQAARVLVPAAPRRGDRGRRPPAHARRRAPAGRDGRRLPRRRAGALRLWARRQPLLEPVVGVRLVVERLDLAGSPTSGRARSPR